MTATPSPIKRPAGKTRAGGGKAVTASSLRSLKLNRAGPRARSGSLVSQAVDALRKRILSAPEADRFLGSEEQLMTALGVSRPTFRQAAKLLEHEQLLKIKRGIGGGFFARPPSATVVNQMAAIFLNAQGTTLRQLNDAMAPMLTEAARLVAKNPDPAVRAQVLDYVRQHESQIRARLDRPKAYLKILLGFDELLGRLGGNPVVALMINMIRDLVRDPRHGYLQIDGAHMRIYARYIRQIAQAVADGDADLAMLRMKRQMDEVNGWLSEIAVDASPKKP